MFRRCLTILVVTCILASNFSRLFVYAGYQLNQKYIAATLCVNRNKPWLHCNGRCYLMKKIKQADEKQKNAERQTQKNLFQDAFCTTVQKIVFSSNLLRIIKSPYTNGATCNIPLHLLRPPQTV